MGNADIFCRLSLDPPRESFFYLCIKLGCDRKYHLAVLFPLSLHCELCKVWSH